MLPGRILARPGRRSVASGWVRSVLCGQAWVYGWDGRLKGICDTLAEQGYSVVMPDFHRMAR